MRIRSIVTVALFLGVLTGMGLAQMQTPPEGGPPKEFTLPPGTTFTLDNGLSATMVKYGLVPKVTVMIMVRCGNLNEGPDETWLADLTGDMMKEGTTTRSAEQIARDAAGMGGEVDINVGADRTSIGGSVLTEFAPDYVALLADVLRHPKLPESELARLKNDRVRDLSIALSQPEQLAQAEFSRVLYPGHPYGRLFPTEPMLRGYTIEQVREFYAKNFDAARTHVYVAGMFDEGKMEEAIRQGFADWPRGAEPLIDIPKPVSQRGIHILDRPGAPQSTVYLGLPVIDPSQPDYRTLLVADALLGGSFASRITTNIRENKGYTYSPFSTVTSHYRTAYWAEFASVTTAVTGPALKEIFYEVDRLSKTPPSEDELKGIQNYLAGIFVLRNSSPGGIINQLAFLDLHGLPDTYLQDYVKAIYAVTPGEVTAMTKKYLRPEDMAIVIAGDRKIIEKQVKSFGRIME